MAAAIMLIAYVGKDHRGTLFQDTMNYISSAAGIPTSGSSSSSLVPSSDALTRHVGNYISNQYQAGYGSGSTATPVSSSTSNDTALSGAQLASGFPDPTDQKQIEQYILQKYQEGYATGLHKTNGG